MKRYNVAARKIAPEDRGVYRSYAESYIEQHGGDDGWSVAVGETARYSVELDEAGVEAFRRASNLEYIEESATDHASGDVQRGVDRDALELHKILTRDGLGNGVLVMVADTGATSAAWVRSRLAEKWTWFADDAMDRNGHGTWCLGAAIPGGAEAVSAKVLGDNGSGANSNGIAALYRFARLCLARKVKGVASLSLGSNSPSQAYKDAVDFCFASGVVVVAAAGNDGRRDGISYPGVYAVSAGAMDYAGGAADFSNRGDEEPDVYAAGVNVPGLPGGKKMSGTSMATPIVARATAIALSGGLEVKRARKRLANHGGKSRILNAGKLARERKKA